MPLSRAWRSHCVQALRHAQAVGAFHSALSWSFITKTAINDLLASSTSAGRTCSLPFRFVGLRSSSQWARLTTRRAGLSWRNWLAASTRTRLITSRPYLAITWNRSYTRSEEHTYELQSIMRNSYAFFSLQNKKH